MDTKKNLTDGQVFCWIPVKRNNLVNFKDTKASTVEIISPNPDELFTKVESSASFRS